MTLTLTAAQYSASVTMPTSPEEVPQLPELLLSLDAASRSDAAQSDLVRTLRVLQQRAELDGRPAAEYLRLAVLVAFKRRNHDKAKAPGTGPGERRVLRTLLIEAYAADPAMVRAVLPLVPLYGSWRDLQVMAELACPPPPPEGAAGAERTLLLPPIAEDIAVVFSEQLQLDIAAMAAAEEAEAAMDVAESPAADAAGGASASASASASGPETGGAEIRQSNACKYAPHEHRHCSARRPRPGKRASAQVVHARRVQRKLGDAVAALLLRPRQQPAAAAGGAVAPPPPPPPHIMRPQYRRLLSRLNGRLAAKGFLVEPLLCASRAADIDFRSAAKGALAKYRKSIMKDAAAAQRWRDAMKTSAAAVADLEALDEFASNVVEELKQLPPPEQLYPLRVVKAVNKSVAARQDLRKKLKALLRQVQKTADDPAAETGSSSSSSTSAALMELLHESAGLVAVPVVDSAHCTAEQFLCLFTEAYIAAASQGLRFIIVDGATLRITREGPAEAVDADAAAPAVATAATAAAAAAAEWVAAAPDAATVSALFSQAVALSRAPHQGVDGSGAADSVRRLDDLGRLRRNSIAALVQFREEVALPREGAADGCAERCDVIYFTRTGLPQASADKDAYAELIDTLQQRRSAAVVPARAAADGAAGAAPRRPAPMRTLLLHKLTAFSAVVDEIPLVMRPARQMPAHRSEVTLDLALVMDLTGSMGSWMEQAKQHLENIVQSLRTDADIGGIRIAFIGYRDFQDSGRLVSHPFVPMHRAREAMAVLQVQRPSGGVDIPEDVLIAYHHALDSLQWESHLRVMLHVADAPAHGYYSSRAGDRYYGGRCPDQLPPMPDLRTTLAQLADVHAVNLLFCRLNSSTEKMEAMFAEVYSHGPGFGVLPMTSGASAFKDAVTSSLSTSLLKALAPADISGLQTFSGGAVSALNAALLTSMRETISAATLRMEKQAEGGDDEGVAAADEGAEKRVEKAGIASTAARSDYVRLMSEIESSDDLLPVRMALGMLEEQSMQEKAATVLLQNGLSVEDLVRHGYPEPIIAAVRAVGLKRARKL